MTLQELLPCFQNVRKSGNGYTALCPAHSDTKRSLSVSEGSGGKILLKCFAGCSNASILNAIGREMKDLFPESEPPIIRFNGNGSLASAKVIDTVYQYTDANGVILYENVRYEPKDFRQRRPDGSGGYIYNLDGIARIPYRLPELIAAIKNGIDEICFTEGEKDADKLRLFGLTATSFKNWTQSLNPHIKDAHAVLFADHDKAGIKQVNDAARIIAEAAKSVKVIDLFGGEPLTDKHGKDVSDWIDQRRAEGLDDTAIAEMLCQIVESADVWQPHEETEQTEIKPFPVPDDEKCFYGLAGEYVRMIEPHTEADKMALLVQFLTYFGNIIGRFAFFQVEADKHFTNLFCVLVGDTASGRKGTSFGRIEEIFKGQNAAYEKDCIVSGLASGEGLLYHIRDAVWEEKTDKKTKKVESVCTDAGVSDKRLLIVESEFSQVLRVQGREGNTLSAFLRNLWDKGTARNLTKNSPLRTTEAHVSIIGHITKAELLNCLNEVESANGYANRFLWLAVRRSKFLPFGSDGIDLHECANFQNKLSERIKFAMTVQRMIFTKAAKQLFASQYERLETSRFGFLAKITQRATAYVCRLSSVFALLDAKDEIDSEHLEAALAVWQYVEDSARYIFGERLGDRNAETILTALRENKNGLNRTEISVLFGGHLSKARLDAVLQSLLETRLARFETTETKGRKKEIWFACEKSEKSEIR